MGSKMPLDRIGELIHTVLTELKNKGGEARLRDLLDAAAPKLSLTPYEKEQYAKTGYVRWQSIVHFYSINCVKAGYIQKNDGIWTLTPEGAKALQSSPGEFVRMAVKKYQAWQDENKGDAEAGDDDGEEKSDEVVSQTAYEQAAEQARSEIERRINSLGPYEFQKLVAELLRAMGYSIRHVAPPGPDGGFDIIAYGDQLGASSPRIIVQVKHRNEKTNPEQVRGLEALLRRDGDAGLFVSRAGFTREATKGAMNAARHVELMDLNRLLELWETHYDNVRESGRRLLPLVRLHFLAPPHE